MHKFLIKKIQLVIPALIILIGLSIFFGKFYKKDKSIDVEAQPVATISNSNFIRIYDLKSISSTSVPTLVELKDKKTFNHAGLLQGKKLIISNGEKILVFNDDKKNFVEVFSGEGIHDVARNVENQNIYFSKINNNSHKIEFYEINAQSGRPMKIAEEPMSTGFDYSFYEVEDSIVLSVIPNDPNGCTDWHIKKVSLKGGVFVNLFSQPVCDLISNSNAVRYPKFNMTGSRAFVGYGLHNSSFEFFDILTGKSTSFDEDSYAIGFINDDQLLNYENYSGLKYFRIFSFDATKRNIPEWVTKLSKLSSFYWDYLDFESDENGLLFQNGNSVIYINKDKLEGFRFGVGYLANDHYFEFEDLIKSVPVEDDYGLD